MNITLRIKILLIKINSLQWLMKFIKSKYDKTST